MRVALARALRRPGAGVVMGLLADAGCSRPDLAGGAARVGANEGFVARPPAGDPFFLPAWSSWRVELPLSFLVPLGPGQGASLSPGAERRLEVPQPVGRAAERLYGPGVAFTQLSGAPAGGGSAGCSSANSAGSAGRGLALTPAPTPESPGGGPSVVVAVA